MPRGVGCLWLLVVAGGPLVVGYGCVNAFEVVAFGVG